MRINKYLSGCGIDSRRKCEQLVLDGRVKINGKKATELATDVKDVRRIPILCFFRFRIFNEWSRISGNEISTGNYPVWIDCGRFGWKFS